MRGEYEPGKPIKKANFQDFRDAEKHMEMWRRVLADGRAGGDVTLMEFVRCVYWPTLVAPPTTKQSKKSPVFGTILPFLGEYALRDIGPEELNLWRKWAIEVKGLDPGTFRTTWQHLSPILQAAKEAGRIDSNPCRGLDSARPPARSKSKVKAWELSRVVAVRSALSERYRVAVDLGVGSGLRPGEVFGFSPDDLAGGVVHVSRQIVYIDGHGLAFQQLKDKEERDVDVAPELEAAVAAHAVAFPPVEVTLPWIDKDKPDLPWERRPLITVPLLITTENRNAVRSKTFNDGQWKSALGVAGVIEWIAPANGKPGMWPTARKDGLMVTRHTFASQRLKDGATLPQVSLWMGHADSNVTAKVYAHFLPAERNQEAVRLSGAWIGAPVVPAPRRPGMRTGPEEAAAEMRAAGLEPLESYPGRTDSPWRCQCTMCGAHGTPRLANVRAGGRGCEPCGRRAAAVAAGAGRRLDPADAAAELRAAGLEPLADYPGTVDEPWPARCGRCGSEGAPRLADIRAGGRGCGPCGQAAANPLAASVASARKRRVDPEQAADEMRTAGVEPLVPYPGTTRAPWLCRCTVCGREGSPRLASIREGQRGCVPCGRVAAAAALERHRVAEPASPVRQ